MPKFESFVELVEKHITLPAPPPESPARPLLLGSFSNVPVGYVRHAFVKYLDGQHGITVFTDCVRISEPYTETLAKALENLRAKATKSDPVLGPLVGWRGERYPVFGEDGVTVVMECERSAAGLLGVKAYGCHLNGYIRDGDGKIAEMWVARRSKKKQTFPGMLDNLVAGALRAGTTAMSTMLAECREEASLDLKAEDLQFSGHLGFFSDFVSEGWVLGIEYCYEWEFKADGPTPQPCDGEVDEFYRMPISEVIERLLDDEFTPSCGLTIVDFLLRKGLISDEGGLAPLLQRDRLAGIALPSYSAIGCYS
ncbi:NUDIX hydrolase domain-like protein [Cladochytrium replicatum]|nr:NUDIX hydrolase domain-like protein [Cladochytrium replicatum]